MRTGMAVGGRQHTGDGVSVANSNMDPEEFDGNFIIHAAISTYQIQNRNFQLFCNNPNFQILKTYYGESKSQQEQDAHLSQM